uniref:Putative inwardly rectifying k+ channel n=1 Tax=Anopheles darlingi TaxID=43151 RepID=A0A2M4DP30_ANODA
MSVAYASVVSCSVLILATTSCHLQQHHNHHHYYSLYSRDHSIVRVCVVELSQVTDIGDNVSTKTQLERRWQHHYSTVMNTLSQYNLPDDTFGQAADGNHLYPTRYLTIQGVPRRRKSYVALQNNLWNLFDHPPNPRTSTTVPGSSESDASPASPRKVRDDDPLVTSVTVQNVNEKSS